MKVLFLGDIVGKPGRKSLSMELSKLIEKKEADIVIVNGENASGGIGISPKVCNGLFELGVDIVTTGNHIFKKKEIYQYLDEEPRLIRPANYPPGAPGKGYFIGSIEKTLDNKVAVINIGGRIFIENLDCPFRTIDRILEQLAKATPIIIVDFHAEATSEKVAMGWYLDGRVSAVIGTHTHVQTADEWIMPEGTAYITDAGMVGPRNSVIGVKKENIIERFKTLMPQKFVVASEDNWINGVLVDIDNESGRALGIERINYKIDDE